MEIQVQMKIGTKELERCTRTLERFTRAIGTRVFEISIPILCVSIFLLNDCSAAISPQSESKQITIIGIDKTQRVKEKKWSPLEIRHEAPTITWIIGRKKIDNTKPGPLMFIINKETRHQREKTRRKREYIVLSERQ